MNTPHCRLMPCFDLWLDQANLTVADIAVDSSALASYREVYNDKNNSRTYYVTYNSSIASVFASNKKSLLGCVNNKTWHGIPPGNAIFISWTMSPGKVVFGFSLAQYSMPGTEIDFDRDLIGISATHR